MWSGLRRFWRWLKALFGFGPVLSVDRDISLIERKTFSCRVGQAVNYQPSFYSGEVVTPIVPPTYYEVLGLPDGLTYSGSTGAITGTPTTVGQYGVTIIAHGPGVNRQATGVLFTIRSA